jgi:D-alanyl-D-alanine dipeptidase
MLGFYGEESEWWKFEPRKHRKHIHVVKEGIKEKA